MKRPSPSHPPRFSPFQSWTLVQNQQVNTPSGFTSVLDLKVLRDQITSYKTNSWISLLLADKSWTVSYYCEDAHTRWGEVIDHCWTAEWFQYTGGGWFYITEFHICTFASWRAAQPRKKINVAATDRCKHGLHRSSNILIASRTEQRAELSCTLSVFYTLNTEHLMTGWRTDVHSDALKSSRQS